MNVKKIICIFFLISNVIFSINFEEGMIELKINKNKYKEEVTAYFYKDDTPMVNITELFQVLGIKKYKISKTEVNFHLNGDNFIKKVDIKKTNKLFLVSVLKIPQIFEKTEIQWDYNSMVLYIKTETKFPKEFLAFQTNRRKKLKENKEDKIIKAKWDIFSPGVLHLGYNKPNIKVEKHLLSANYINQVFYGSLNLNATYEKKKIDIDNFSWKRPLGSERQITIGDIYTSRPFDIGKSNALRGISILGKDSWDNSLNVTNKTIHGYASNSSVVELYENGILKDYQIVKNGEFNFEIKTTGGARNYEIWTYKLDGSIDKKSMAIYSSDWLNDEGEFDYKLQLGVDKKDIDLNIYNTNISYGVTENLTFKVGSYNSRVDSQKKDFLNFTPLYRIDGTGNWSHFISGDYSINPLDESENFYQLKFENKSRNHNNIFGYEDYKNLDTKFLNDDYDEKYYWKNNFLIQGINAGLSYENERNHSENKELERYGINLHDTFFKGRITGSLDFERENIRFSTEREINNIYGLAATYYIRDKVFNKYINNITFSGEYEDCGNSSFGITFQKNRNKTDNWDYYLELKQAKKETTVEFAFTYRLGNWMNIRSTTHKNSMSTVNGLEINTSVDFSGPQKIKYSENFGDSSIRGKAFLDINGNGILDKGEKGIPEIKIKSLSGDSITSKKGDYYLSFINSKITHKLKVENENIDYLLNYSAPENYSIKTLPGGILNLNIPVKMMKTVVVSIDFDSKFYFEEVKQILEESHLEITDLNTQKKIYTEINDENIVMQIPQGEYTFEVVLKEGGKTKLFNNSYEVVMRNDQENEEYLDIKVSRYREKFYSVELYHNGTALYNKGSIKKFKKGALKVTKGGN